MNFITKPDGYFSIQDHRIFSSFSFKMVRKAAKIILAALCGAVFLTCCIINYLDPRRSPAEDQINWGFDACDAVKGSNERVTSTVAGLLRDVNEVNVVDESIFFHETCCSEDLNSRQSCAIESAAKANPRTQVFVLLTSPKASLGPKGGRNLRILVSSYSNIHFHYLNLKTYSMKTPLEPWVRSGILFNSSHKVSHLSDALRFLTLWKYGGTYFDLDVVVMRSLEGMKNFIGEENEGVMASGVINLEGRGIIAEDCLKDFVSSYRGDLWRHNGPDVFERVLHKFCKHQEGMKAWADCASGFKVYPPWMFYPVKWQEWRLYFDENSSEETMKRVNKSIAVHVWNKLSSEEKIRVGSRQPYGLIAAQYCPKTYENTGDFF